MNLCWQEAGCYGRKETGNQDCGTYAQRGLFGFWQRAGGGILDRENIWENQEIRAYQTAARTIAWEVGFAAARWKVIVEQREIGYNIPEKKFGGQNTTRYSSLA